MPNSILIGMLLTFLISIGAAVALFIFSKISNKKGRIALSILIFFVVFITGFFISNSQYLHATKDVLSYMEGNAQYTVTEVDNGYFFDGPGEDTVFIFYAGAYVDSKAYAPMLAMLAENGIDCFIPDPLFHLALAGSSEDFRLHHDYKNVYYGGHSFGGVNAASYVSKHGDVKGIVFLASYTVTKLSDNLKCVTIYGSNDGVLNLESYKENYGNLPKDYEEIVIDGGNHAQFGYYGFQKGDNEASISAEEQIQRTVDAILDLIQ